MGERGISNAAPDASLGLLLLRQRSMGGFCEGELSARYSMNAQQACGAKGTGRRWSVVGTSHAQQFSCSAQDRSRAFCFAQDGDADESQSFVCMCACVDA